MTYSAPFCDFVTVTVPEDQGAGLRRDLSDVCLQLPGAETDPLGVRLGKFGLLRFAERPGISIISASGVVTAALRAARLLDEFCAAVACSGPYHKVTRLDAASDLSCDPPSVVVALRDRLRRTGCHLSRKWVAPSRISFVDNLREDGRVTGTVYVGRRKSAETTAAAYDRQHNCLVKGMPDPGPLVRFEIRTGVPGLVLRDVVEPAPVFYRYASPDLVPRPDGVPEWAPYGEGFSVVRRERSDLERLEMLVDTSADLGRMFRLVDGLDGDGLAELERLIRRRFKRHVNGLAMGVLPTAAGASVH
jgi:hypothetical protein